MRTPALCVSPVIIVGGPAQPVIVVSDPPPVGDAALPVYGWIAEPDDGRSVVGGSATPIYLVSAADIANGTFRVVGNPALLPMALVQDRPVIGQRPIAVYVLGGTLVQAPVLSGTYISTEAGDHIVTEAGEPLITE